MAAIQQKQAIGIGDKLIFDKNKTEVFKAETSGTDKAIRQYQQIVLGGVGGWDVLVPAKYLIVLPQEL